MADRRARVALALDDNFAVGIARALEATSRLRAELAKYEATWEPHDWSDF